MSAQHEPRKRRFNVGDEFSVGGVDFRCVKGKKLDVNGKPFGDVCLEWWGAGGWAPVGIDTMVAAFDCIAENEDFRYPYPKRGGEYTLQAFRDTRIRGWRYAVDKLHRERKSFQERAEEAAWFNQDRDQGETE